MSRPYFRYIPNFEYVNRLKENKTLSEFIVVKNIFRRGELNFNVINDLSYFTKYQIVGDERPDQVAYKVYDDQYYDWLVLLCNNIVNFQDEWPMSQRSFEKYMYGKYVTDQNINSIHHYETLEVRNSIGDIIVPSGLTVPADFSVSYYDTGKGTEITEVNIAQGITNLQYETKKEEDKRNIFVLKANYASLIGDELNGSLLYEKGSTQYVNNTLVRGENIRLYN